MHPVNTLRRYSQVFAHMSRLVFAVETVKLPGDWGALYTFEGYQSGKQPIETFTWMLLCESV